MGRVLCTFPGRAGDLLWALPAIRAIAESGGQPVDLQIAGEFAGILPVLATCPYLGKVFADPRWGLTPPEEWLAPPAWPPREEGGPYESFATPPDPLVAYDHVYHLGYRGWPQRPLPEETYLQAVIQVGRELPPLNLARPWITVPTSRPDAGRAALVVGFTEAWFELKLGIVQCLQMRTISELRDGIVLTPKGSRWEVEGGWEGTDWADAAQLIRDCTIFLGDCSALHVLAVAQGVPVVVVEPMEARWNPIFYPLGMDGPQVTMVRGLDGRPTFDARHTAETLEEVIRARLL